VNSLQKRQAIKDALTPFIQGRQLANALNLWDEKYSHQNHFALQHYLRELCYDVEVAHLRSRMLQALVTAFSSLQDERQARQQQAQRVRKTIVSNMSSGYINELTVFVLLVEKLIESLNDEMSTRTRLYVLENLTKVKLTSQERLILQQWLNRITPLRHDLKLNHTVMQHVINLAYVAICEYQGPIKADQTLQASVSQIKTEFPDISIDFLL
jgi:cysteinyl-tRNA synthetase